MKSKEVGVLSIQGLPARHGAFEQAIDQLVRYSNQTRPDIHFVIGCSIAAIDEVYEMPNVTRLFFKRRGGLGVIFYGLKAFVSMYLRGVRTYLIMGYGLAPFFWLFELLGCRLLCNVDGFEWRRAKWGKLARFYFKLCESLSVKSRASLIYDSNGVARYYGINYKRNGDILFYGTDPISEEASLTIQDLGEKPYFVVVMRMEPENHILEIVRAYLRSRASHRLLLIGPSTPFFERNVKPLIDDDQLNRVVWLGPIYDRVALHAFRSGAYAYIHGHSVGGTNPTLVEACELGRPIIAYASIFNKEVLGLCGTYFRNENALMEILNDEERSLNYPPKLDERYTWKYVCEGYLKLLG